MTEPADMPIMPPEAPLAMPDQRLRERFHDPYAPPAARQRMWRRRLLVLVATGLLTAGFVTEMTAILAANRLTELEIATIALFGLTFVWLAFTLVNATVGAIARHFLKRAGQENQATALHIALLMPTYNETPDRVVGNAVAMLRALGANRSRHRYDLFFLSDTRDDAIAAAEVAAIAEARRALGPDARIYYRRRSRNVGRKAGNIREWCERYGGAYDAMVTLDADSLMSAHAIDALADAMAADPGVGLVQSVPKLINTPTLFGRLQRFATAAYGPLLAEGTAYWSGDDGNYWGHNAILRTRAFAASAGLPELTGRGFLGGAILSHDFVEAALLRRAGWRVRVLPALSDSYEESPPTLIDAILRDRRWSQGNLQHLALIGAKGFPLVNRFHMLQGIMAYLAAPLWCLFLLAGVGVEIEKALAPAPAYLTTNWFLYDPLLPTDDPDRAFTLLCLTLLVLAAPKLIGLVSTLLQARGARRWGGVGLIGSVLLELLLSSLIAPIMMIHQTKAVIAAAMGRDAGWKPQAREAGGVRWRDVLRFHWLETTLGLAAAAALLLGWLSIWLAPIALSLTLAAPISALLSLKTDRLVRATGVLSTPEDVRRPSIVARAAELYPLFAGTRAA